MKNQHALDVPKRTRYTVKEEMFNCISHGVGVLLAIAALVILVVFATLKGDIWQIVSFSIYGATLILLYLFSTLYHGIFNEKAKRVFRVFDHAAIYLLIAGSYTPLLLVFLRGAWGWAMFGIVWALAITGIIMNIVSLEGTRIFSTILYILMGWVAVIAIKPMLDSVPPGLLRWIFTGGVIYTVGVLFYVWKKLPYHHGIWHLFVLGGSIVHFLGFLYYLG